MGVSSSLPQTFWEEPKAGPTLHLALYLALSSHEDRGQLQWGCVLTTRDLLSPFCRIALFRAGACPQQGGMHIGPGLPVRYTVAGEGRMGGAAFSPSL